MWRYKVKIILFIYVVWCQVCVVVGVAVCVCVCVGGGGGSSVAFLDLRTVNTARGGGYPPIRSERWWSETRWGVFHAITSTVAVRLILDLEFHVCYKNSIVLWSHHLNIRYFTLKRCVQFNWPGQTAVDQFGREGTRPYWRAISAKHYSRANVQSMSV